VVVMGAAAEYDPNLGVYRAMVSGETTRINTLNIVVPVNKRSPGSTYAVLGADADGYINLKPNATTTITLVVTSQDGTHRNEYTLLITRGAVHRGIRIRAKVFLEGPLQ